MNQYQKVKLSEIVPNNYNPKIDFRADVYNRKMYNKVVESLKKHGQIDPIIVRELEDGKFEIINGYHRFCALQELGYLEAEIKNLGKMKKDEAIAKALSTEYIKIPLDEIEVAKLLKNYQDDGYDIEELPYNVEEFNEKINLIDGFEEDSYEENFEKRLSKVTCPECGHKFEK